MKKAYITFDLDFEDYISGVHVDEMDLFFPIIKQYLISEKNLKFTWFIRIDRQIEKLFGNPLYYFEKHYSKFKWLTDNGHAIGWHHHAYKQNNNKWQQETDSYKILTDLNEYGSIAKNIGMNICRMGWGYHTNDTMQQIISLGFKIDSSAISRPQYKWDSSVKDWEGTSNEWYYPSKEDYRIAGCDSCSILEVPITTTVIPFETDTQSDVIRYLNLAFEHEIFKIGFAKVNQLDRIVTVTHPYELLMRPDMSIRNIISFNFNSFTKNVSLIKDAGFSFDTLD